ncbi:MAG: hypothetical protein WD118_08565 [Phycisphaeraceae bacterium]
MVSVKYPFVYEDVDRHGNVRLYFWRGRGHSKIRMREAPGTTAFAARYEELLNGAAAAPAPQRKPGRSAVTPGSWRWLCTEYFASMAFRRLEPSTQTTRRRILELTYDEPVAPGTPETLAEFPLSRLTAKALRVLRDRRADRPEAANGRVRAIRPVFNWAMDEEHIRTNPARDLARIRTASPGWHSWTIEEVEQYEKRQSHRHEGTARAFAAALQWRTAQRCRPARPTARARQLVPVSPT